MASNNRATKRYIIRFDGQRLSFEVAEGAKTLIDESISFDEMRRLRDQAKNVRRAKGVLQDLIKNLDDFLDGMPSKGEEKP